MNHPVIILLSGPGGAGKSTVLRLVAEILGTCAVVDADVIRNMVVAGFVDPFLKEGVEQYTLGMHNTATLAHSFYDAGFNVVIDGGASRKEYLDIYYSKLKDINLVSLLLLPSKKTLIERDAKRDGKSKLGEKGINFLYDRFDNLAKTETRWSILDNTNLSPTETAEAILKMKPL